MNQMMLIKARTNRMLALQGRAVRDETKRPSMLRAVPPVLRLRESERVEFDRTIVRFARSQSRVAEVLRPTSFAQFA